MEGHFAHPHSAARLVVFDWDICQRFLNNIGALNLSGATRCEALALNMRLRIKRQKKQMSKVMCFTVEESNKEPRLQQLDCEQTRQPES